MNTNERYGSEMRDGIEDSYKRVESDIIVHDSLPSPGEYGVKRMAFVTPIVVLGHDRSLDRGVDHKVEAAKVFGFLQDWISCRSYDIIYKMMTESECENNYDPLDELNCVSDSCQDRIHELERTILVLESVRKLYVEGACAGCMSGAVRTMVDNEVALLRNKVDAMTAKKAMNHE